MSVKKVTVKKSHAQTLTRKAPNDQYPMKIDNVELNKQGIRH